MGGVEERGFLRGSDRTGQECAAGSAPRPACLAAVPRGALSAPPAMPHFTVVPVEDKPRAEYDSVEGLSWVDYREPAAAPAPGDSYDTVSSDGERARPGGGRRCPAPGARASPAARPAVPGTDKGGVPAAAAICSGRSPRQRRAAAAPLLPLPGCGARRCRPVSWPGRAGRCSRGCPGRGVPRSQPGVPSAPPPSRLVTARV